MRHHIRSLSIDDWVAVGTRIAVMAFSLRVLWLLIENMGMTLDIFGSPFTIVVLWVHAIALWFCVETIIHILDPRNSVSPPQGYGDSERTPASSESPSDTRHRSFAGSRYKGSKGRRHDVN